MAKEPLVLYRRRFIPNETVCLRGDHILHYDGRILITSWSVLHPRSDFSRGYSLCYLEEGYRISRLIRPDNRFLYWYCDIMDFTFDEEGKSLVMTDLLADVIVYPDGSIRLLDLGELADAHAEGLIDSKTMERCLRRLNRLLDAVYQSRFPELARPIENYQ